MKRYIYSMIVLGAAAVGCTKSGLVESPQKYQEPITFDIYTGKAPSTKASIVTTATLATHTSEKDAAFHVNAFAIPQEGSADYTNYYMNEDLWCSSTSGTEPDQYGYITAWKYNGATYWPDNGTLQFVAYGLNAAKSIGGKDAVTDESGAEITPAVPGTPIMNFDKSFPYSKFTYTVPTKTSEQEDLILAVPVTQSITNNSASNVLLNFKHVLARVGFTLQTDTKGVMVTIRSVKLKGSFYNDGIVDLTAETPTITGQTASVTTYSLFDNVYTSGQTTGTYDYFQMPSPGEAGIGIYPTNNLKLSADGNVDTKLSDGEANRYMMLIPSTQTNATIEVVYELEGSKEKPGIASLGADFEFKAGMAYEFIIKISTASIEFETEITPWDEYFTAENGDSDNEEDKPVLKPIN